MLFIAMLRLSCLILISCIDFSLNAHVQPRAKRNEAQNLTFLTEISNTLELCKVPEVHNIWNSTSKVHRSCDVKIPSNVSDLRFEFDHPVFLCTALYEYSKHVCKNGLSRLPNITLPVTPIPSEFCKNSSSTLTQNSTVVNAAESRPLMESYINNIKNEAKCERVCIIEEEVNPLCENIYKLNVILQYYDIVSQGTVNKNTQGKPSSGNSAKQSAPNIHTAPQIPVISSPNKTVSAAGAKKIALSGSVVPVQHNEQIPANIYHETDIQKLGSNFGQISHETNSQEWFSDFGEANDQELLPGTNQTAKGGGISKIGDKVVPPSMPVDDSKSGSVIGETPRETGKIPAGKTSGEQTAAGEMIAMKPAPGDEDEDPHKSAQPGGKVGHGENSGPKTVNSALKSPLPVGKDGHVEAKGPGLVNNPPKSAPPDVKAGIVEGNGSKTVNAPQKSPPFTKAGHVQENGLSVGSNLPKSVLPSGEVSHAEDSSNVVLNKPPQPVPGNGKVDPNTDLNKASNLPSNSKTLPNAPQLEQTADTEEAPSIEISKPAKTVETKPEVSISELPVDDETPQQPDSFGTEITGGENNENEFPVMDKDGFHTAEEDGQVDSDENDLTENLVNLNANAAGRDFIKTEDSHFFAYFMTMIVLCIIGYLVFHNKQKILALALEGRSRRGTRRRPNTAGYRKLDSTLEEAVTSGCSSSSVTHVIY